MHKKTFYIQSLSALHVGTGQGVGVVDLPIARSKATNLPIVPGSGLKGVLRDALKEGAAEADNSSLSDKDIKTLFGPMSDTMEDNPHAGAIAFGDANLLLLPIRSFAGTMAYATCPYVLRQYQRDANFGLDIPVLQDQAGVITNSALIVPNTQKIALEDLDIEVNSDAYDSVKKWADVITADLYPDSVDDASQWREMVAKRMVILPDDIFSFLADTATEVRTRIRIDRETRIVKDGALWTEENLPAETVLWGVIGVAKSRNPNDKSRTAEELAALLPSGEIHIQLGGKHTVGRGLCRMIIKQENA